MSRRDDLRLVVTDARTVDHGGDGGGKPPGPPGGGDGSGGGPRDDAGRPLYLESAKGTWWRQTGRNGESLVLLSNVRARIEAQVIHQDGSADPPRFIRIRAWIADRPPVWGLSTLSELRTGAWLDRMFGADAISQPGDGMKERLGHAVHTLSLEDHGGAPPLLVTHTVLGWATGRRGRPMYVHGTGAIDEGGVVPDVDVQPGPDPLTHLGLPAPPTGEALRTSVASVLRLLDLAPLPVMAALVGLVFRSVHGHVRFVVWLEGRTGVYKSQIAALIQAFFGASITSERLPSSFESTTNFLETVLHRLGDMVGVIDDYAPLPDAQAMRGRQAAADRLIRGQSNHGARGRLNADSSIRDGKPPRGAVLITAEDMPPGASIVARCLILRLRPGDVSATALTACQRDAAAGLYASALAAFVRHVAGDLDGCRARLAARAAALAAEVDARGAHARTPGQLGDVAAALEGWLRSAEAAGALDPGEADRRFAAAWEALRGLAAGQGEAQREEDRARMFVRLLAAALRARLCHLVSPHDDASRPDPDAVPGSWGWLVMAANGAWMGCGTKVGWVDQGGCYLDPDAAYGVVQEMARRQGVSLGLTKAALWTRLREAGLLKTSGERNLYAKKVAGRKVWTLRLPLDALRGEAWDGTDPGPEPSDPGPDHSDPGSAVPTADRYGNHVGNRQHADSKEENGEKEAGSQVPTRTGEDTRDMLADVLNVLVERGADKLEGEVVAAELNRRLPRPWWPDRDRVVTGKRLAVLMRDAGAPPDQLGGRDGNHRGYRRGDVAAALGRLDGMLDDPDAAAEPDAGGDAS